MILLILLVILVMFFLLFKCPFNSLLLRLCLRRGARRVCLVAVSLHHPGASEHVEQLLGSDVESIFWSAQVQIMVVIAVRFPEIFGKSF